MYEDRTEEKIKKEMLDGIDVGVDKREGTFIFDAISPTAVGLAQVYTALSYQLQRAFASTAAGEDLELRAAEQGITRRPAAKAIGELSFTGTDGTILPKGTLASTADGVMFETTAEGTVSGGQVTLPAQAVEEGGEGNTPAGSVVSLPVATPGVTAVTNAAPFIGGEDTETDEELRQRYFEQVHTPATSGNKYHYKVWAKEVPGIGDAKVFPLWDGPGTVKVVVIDADKRAATPELVSAVVDHIETERPIGADVTVISGVEKEINITADVTLAHGYTIAQVQALYQEAIIEYFKEVAFVDSYVSHAQLGRILLETAGVGDHTNLLINGDINNILLGEEETPVLGTLALGVA